MDLFQRFQISVTKLAAHCNFLKRMELIFGESLIQLTWHLENQMVTVGQQILQIYLINH